MLCKLQASHTYFAKKLGLALFVCLAITLAELNLLDKRGFKWLFNVLFQYLSQMRHVAI